MDNKKRGRPKGSKNKPKQIAIPPVVLEVPRDQFVEEDTCLPMDLHTSSEYSRNDIQEELEHLEGFREFSEEITGNNLTFGDY